MRRFGWPRPPLLIGFVLSHGAETYLYQAIQFHEWAWLWRPGVLIIAAFTLASIWVGTRFGRTGIDEGGETGRVRDTRPQLLFGAFIAIAFAYGIYDSLQQSYLAKIFPLGLSISALAGSLVVLALMQWGPTTGSSVFDTEAETPPGMRSMEYYLAWLLGLMAVSAVTGFLIGLGLFFAVFLHIEARAPLWRNAILTASAMLFLIGMAYIFVLDFPGGLLQDLVEMPWPFR
jgi:putative tricarboxylic transport membrane protein